MPEIAEVETVRNVLKNQVLNKKIVDVKIIYPKIIETDILQFKDNLINNEFIDIDRIGKYLIFKLHNYSLISHLRMEGKYFIKDKNEEMVKHEHLVIYFSDNTTLRYHDTRKFGRMALLKTNDLKEYQGIKKQGFEPGDSLLTVSYLKEKLKNKSLPIKTILLDQTIISGLGNIYANEVLFESNINPHRKGSSITDKELQSIITSSDMVIKKAISMGGTTIKSYTSSLGVTGRFQQELKVHKLDNKPCFKCGTIIKKEKINGRSAYYCEKCQK